MSGRKYNVHLSCPNCGAIRKYPIPIGTIWFDYYNKEGLECENCTVTIPVRSLVLWSSNNGSPVAKIGTCENDNVCPLGNTYAYG